MDDKSVKKKMKELREKENLSQLETAEKLGMSLRSYNSLETGPTRIFNKNLVKFADLTGCKLEDIMFDSPEDTELSQEQKEFLLYKEMHLESIKTYEKNLSEVKKALKLKNEKIAELEDRLKDKEKVIRLLEKQHDNG